MLTVSVAVITLFVVSVISWFVKYLKYETYLKRIPGPTPIPIFGNALLFRDNSKFLATLLKLQEIYGKIKVYIGYRSPILMVSDAKSVELVLSSTTIIEKSDNYEILHNWLGTGLLTSGGQKWRKHRRMLTPAFHFNILEQFISVFNKFGTELIQRLENDVGKSSIDIMSHVTLCSLDIICASSLGTVVNAQKNVDSAYITGVLSLCGIFLRKMISPIKSNGLLYLFTADCYRENSIVKSLHNYTNSVIASRRKEIEKSSDIAVEENDEGIKKRLSFLDLMLQRQMLKNDITSEEIRQEVDTFTFEGHDTTASGIGFTLYLISAHPDVQDKVVDELDSIFSDDKTRPATYNDLQDMKYLEMVIKESLRIYPSVPLFGRTIETDTEFDGYILPKGLQLLVFIYGLHRNPEVFPDPEKFDPERFSMENQKGRSPYAYVPFSAGSRNCIGQKFAMLEMKSMVSIILRHFELLPPTPAHVPKVTGNIILKPATGINVSLRKRKM